MELQNPNQLVAPYIPVIKAFKNRYDVQNGNALGYREGQVPTGELKFENWPKSIGFGLATTGFCVSVSQAFLLDPIFQILIKDRGAYAKLVSIDIKEQYYGNCYSGTQNRWHTAILVQDSNQNFIIDLTCFQFGNKFANKDIWDFETWEKTFRSPLDKHVIVDFQQNVLNFLPIQNMIKTKEFDSIFTENALHSISTITDGERKLITDFFLNQIEIINTKLILGNINKFDYEYLDKINKLLQNLDFKTGKEQYFVMEFINKKAALGWVEKFLKNDSILQQYIILSGSIEDSCQYFGINQQNINKESLEEKNYVILEFAEIKGISVDFIGKLTTFCIPYGIKLTVEKENIFNGGKILAKSVGLVEKKTNTIYIKCSN